MEQSPIMESLCITLTCACGQPGIRVTLISQLYHDARCPQCQRIWMADITIKEEAP
jgi:hypothetical protein